MKVDKNILCISCFFIGWLLGDENKKLFNIVILTHKCKKKSMDSATTKLNTCHFLKEKAVIMQVLHV